MTKKAQWHLFRTQAGISLKSQLERSLSWRIVSRIFVTLFVASYLWSCPGLEALDLRAPFQTNHSALKSSLCFPPLSRGLRPRFRILCVCSRAPDLNADATNKHVERDTIGHPVCIWNAAWAWGRHRICVKMISSVNLNFWERLLECCKLCRSGESSPACSVQWIQMHV